MCRILIYHGREPITMADLITKPTHSIIRQSYASLERIDNSPLNGDGFGIGWYTMTGDIIIETKKVENQKEESQTPCVFLSVTPAWNNLNLIRLAEKIKSPLFFWTRACCVAWYPNERNELSSLFVWSVHVDAQWGHS